MNRRPRLFFLILTACVAIFGPLRAQDSLKISLEQCIAQGLAKGFLASDVAARYASAKKVAESARRRQWTSVSLDVLAPDFSESLSQQFNPLTGTFDYYRLKQTTLQGSLTISQPLTFSGGTLRVSQLLLRRDQTSGLQGISQDLRDYYGSLAIEFQQPLLTPNLLRVNDLRARISLDQAETDFLQQQLDLIYQITQGYYAVYQLSRQLAITRDLVQQNEESYETAIGKSRAGLIPEVEALQSEVDLASSRNDSLNAARELAAAANALRLLIGMPSGAGVEPTEDVTFKPTAINEEEAVASALQLRSELLTAARAIDLRGADIDQARSQSGFRVDLSARYGLNRDDTGFSTLFQNPNASRGATVSLSVPIFDWGGAGLNVEAAEIQFRSAKDREAYLRQQIRQEVIDLVNKIRVAESRLHVLEKSVDVAQRSYDISLERFRNGTITRNDLAQAQQRLTQAKTATLSALIDYRLGMADLRRKTLLDPLTGSKVVPILPPEE